MRLAAPPSTGEQVREVASGIDALYLSGRAALPEVFLQRLAGRRAAAETKGRSQPFDLGGTMFEIASRGIGKYRYCLTHKWGQVGVSPSGKLPAFRVQPRTEFLHGAGVRDACEWFMRLLERVVGVCVFTVSRIDLYGDFQGWNPTGEDRHRFVFRARELDTYEDSAELTGFTFGRRTSGTITARIYDKSRQMEQKGADFWPTVWGEKYDKEAPVFRVEFELARAALRQYDVNTLQEALDAVPALWLSVSTEWLTYRCPTADETRSRWPVAPEWQVVQRASLGEGAFGIRRMYDGRTKGTVRKLTPMLNGTVAHLGALLGTSGIDDTLLALAGVLRDAETITRRAFSDRIAEWKAKEAVYGAA
jgi:hypothetical protein